MAGTFLVQAALVEIHLRYFINHSHFLIQNLPLE